MPELPEIEVILQGLAPHVVGNIVTGLDVHTSQLRWPISVELAELLPGQTIQGLERRGKYLLMHCSLGTVLIHLGMTGYLRLVPSAFIRSKHDHLDINFKNDVTLRLNDVRRFGTVLWVGTSLREHRLLADLGPEPLTTAFNGTYLYQLSRKRTIAVKHFIMDHKVIAGVGNIYANEALFYAGIRPSTPAGRISTTRYHQLSDAIKQVLTDSILAGGTMLDHRDGTEKTGYFSQQLAVYNRSDEPCPRCSAPIQYKRLGQRSIYYCKSCQT
jgi:formamidopyrimidine-DNA glycosylase